MQTTHRRYSEAAPLPDAGDVRLRRLGDLWNTSRRNRPIAAYADLAVLDHPEWLGHLSLIEVLEGGLDFRYRVYGSAMAAYYGRDLTGKTTRALPTAVGSLVRREYAQAYAERRPLLVQRRRRVRGVSIMIVKLILPLTSDGDAIDLLLAASYPHS
jgi:hypothetical protein